MRSEAGHSLPGLRWGRGGVQVDRGRHGEVGPGGLQGWGAPEVVQLLQNWEPSIWTWTDGELRQLWTWRRRWKMMLGQLGVGWVEAQSDQALVEPLGSASLDCASSGSTLQGLKHWWHCAQDEVEPEACLQLLRDRTVLPLPVHDQPYDQWKDGLARLEKLQDSPSCRPASQAVDNTELVGRPTSASQMPVELQVVTAAAVVVVVAVAAAVVEDPCEPGGILKTDPILLKSGEPCRGTEGWETCEVGSRGRGVERTAALCEGKAASVGVGIGLGEGTER